MVIVSGTIKWIAQILLYMMVLKYDTMLFVGIV